MVDLKTGSISTINTSKGEEDTYSFSLYSNDTYVMYDRAREIIDGQELIYWNQKNPTQKEHIIIPHGYTGAIFIQKNDAYVVTEDPDAITWIHHINLKNNKVLASEKLNLDYEEYSQAGLPSNPSLTFFNGFLYYAVNKPSTLSKDSEIETTNGHVVKLNPKTMRIEGKLPIKDNDFNPDSLVVVENQLVVLSTYAKSYVLRTNGQFEKVQIEMPKK